MADEVTFDTTGLTKFERDIINLANDKMPKESKKFLMKEGTKLKRIDKQTESTMVGYLTGDLENSFKRGKIYDYYGSLSVRSYSSSPHAHLQNDGFWWSPHKKRHVQNAAKKFIPGTHFMDVAYARFTNTYYGDCVDFVKDIIDKGL